MEQEGAFGITGQSVDKQLNTSTYLICKKNYFINFHM